MDNSIRFTHSKVVERVLPHWSRGWRSICDPRHGNLVRPSCCLQLGRSVNALHGGHTDLRTSCMRYRGRLGHRLADRRQCRGNRWLLGDRRYAYSPMATLVRRSRNGTTQRRPTDDQRCARTLSSGIRPPTSRFVYRSTAVWTGKHRGASIYWRQRDGVTGGPSEARVTPGGEPRPPFGRHGGRPVGDELTEARRRAARRTSVNVRHSGVGSDEEASDDEQLADIDDGLGRDGSGQLCVGRRDTCNITNK